MGDVIYRPVFGRFVDSVVQRLDPVIVANAEGWVWGVDLGAGANAVLVVCATLEHGNRHVLYEVVGSGGGLDELLSLAMTLPTPAPEAVVFGPDGLNRDAVSGRRPVDVVDDYGLRWGIVVQSLRTSLQALRSMMDDTPGLSSLTVHPRCLAVGEALSLYAVRQAAGGGIETVTPQVSHALDALRYATANRVAYAAPWPRQNKG